MYTDRFGGRSWGGTKYIYIYMYIYIYYDILYILYYILYIIHCVIYIILYIGLPTPSDSHPLKSHGEGKAKLPDPEVASGLPVVVDDPLLVTEGA